MLKLTSVDFELCTWLMYWSSKIRVCCKAWTCLEVQDVGCSAERIQLKGKIVCAGLRTDKTRCCHAIFIFIVLFRALGNGLERIWRTCVKLGEANQNRKPDRMKTSLYKFKDQFGKMLERDIYFHNLNSSSGERHWANSSNIENPNFTAQKINRVIRICLNITWKCKLRLVKEYGVFEPEFARSREGHLGRGDLHKWIGNNVRALL